MTKNKKRIDERVYDTILDKLIEEARTNFYVFVKLLAPTILPEEFIDGKHIEIICKKLQMVHESVADKTKTPKRIQIFLPPGSMKSKIASNLFPAWCIGKNPNWCFLAIGSDFEFAIDNFGRPTKDLVESEQYQAIFPGTVLRNDVASAGRWDTTRKGRFVARGAGQNIAGRRAHIAICDDVITEQTTDTDRKKINKWYQKGLRTRLLPRGAEIVINTRWHTEDLSGYLLSIDGKTNRPWEVIRIPALLDEEASAILKDGNPKEKRFDVGTSFWPELWTTEILQEKRLTLTPSEWNALYMQTPTSEEGNIIRRADFVPWTEPDPPECKYIIVSMDTAFSQSETADYSAYTVWGVFDNYVQDFEGNQVRKDCIILLAAGKGRWDFAELCSKAVKIDHDYSPDFFIIEKKASGQSLITEMRKRGLPIMDYTPDRDKMFRLQACTPFFKSQRIFVPANRVWATEVVEEVVSFPVVPHDDYTDTVSQAVLWLKEAGKLSHDGYLAYLQNTDDEEEEFFKGQRKTYWSSVMGQ